MIISRYLIKEILNALLAVTVVLLLIFLSQALVRFLGYAAVGKLAANILFRLIGFEIPYLLALLLPLGLYLGIILAYGRLYADSEMRVMHACGLGFAKLTAITSILTVVMTGVVVILTLWVNPWLAAQKESLIAHSLSTNNVIDSLMPGRFQVSGDGKRVLYVEQITRNHKQANNIFIADQAKKSADDNKTIWSIVSAAQGSQLKDPKTRDRFLVAMHGSRYEGMPGKNDFKIVEFKKYSVKMPATEIITKRQHQESIPTKTLWQSYVMPDSAAELQWRLSIPLATFILGLLAIPFSYVPPRRGRYSQIVPAILLYIIYVNLLFVARNWIEQKILPIGVGMWWIHSFMLLVAIIFMMIQSGSVKQYIRRFRSS